MRTGCTSFSARRYFYSNRFGSLYPFLVVAGLAAALNLTTLRILGQQSTLTQIQGNTDQGIVLPPAVPFVPRLDPGALQEIHAYRNAIHLDSWSDMQGTGQLTSTATESDGSVGPKTATVWIRGHGCRLDIEKQKGTSSMRINGASGSVQHADGSRKSIDARDAVAELFAFPMLMDASFPSLNLVLIDLGMVAVNGAVLHGITAERPWPGDLADSKGNPFTTATNLYFDPQTHLLLKSATAVAGQRVTPQRFLRVITYGDYRAVGVMQVPFQYRETLNGQIIWTLQLTAVQLNQGLLQSSFQF